jgi:hypothetical protein
MRNHAIKNVAKNAMTSVRRNVRISARMKSAPVTQIAPKKQKATKIAVRKKRKLN